jgi:hypothetical protein
MGARSISVAVASALLIASCGDTQNAASSDVGSSLPDVVNDTSSVVTPIAAPTRCSEPPFGEVPSSPPHAIAEVVAPWVDAHPELFAGMWWDGATEEFVFPTVSVDRATALITTELPADLSYRVELVGRSASDLESLQIRASELGLDGFQGSGRRVWDATVEINLAVLDQSSIDTVTEAFEANLDGICLTGADPDDVVPEGPQPTAGAGWRLLADQMGKGEPYTAQVALGGGEYDMLWSSLGLDGEQPTVDFDTEIVVQFGAVYSGSCPEIRLDDVVIDQASGSVTAEIVQLGGERICTSDANPRSYLVAIDRSALPQPPFTVSAYPDCSWCTTVQIAR